MKISRISSINNYLKCCNKQFITETKKNPKLKLRKADCFSYVEITDGNIKGLPDYYKNKPAMDIAILRSYYLGAGTRAIKNVVKESLKNPKTQGRVTLTAACVDNMTNPLGFYYKLGFRSIFQRDNKMCEYWMKHGAKKTDAPWADWSFMYLPMENIQHCLNYPNKIDAIGEGLSYVPKKK